MSDRITGVRPRNRAKHRVAGLQVHGRETRAAMIEEFREHYQRQLEEAQQALLLSDGELIVETYRGPMAQNEREEVRDD